nr:heavy-metal-associated domain-containing protein [Clostridium paraputrificum]
MKSVIKIYDMNKSSDAMNIQGAIASNEGVIACEVSLDKKEIQLIYNESFVTLDKIIESIEILGYIVVS